MYNKPIVVVLVVAKTFATCSIRRRRQLIDAIANMIFGQKTKYGSTM